ncbi:MAG: hypothetical protein AM325_002920 [Candidatus Thorarchaeota archaeon SMTZ1-45]|nr:MAG: hypothetical protein AM325_04715 [Candidatus Thorarchaeota archaeon SMTZ1-45]
MSKDLERALSKLRFDDQVLGYSLMTKVGRPFVSFAFPDELFPRIKDSINLYKSDLRLMTIDTDRGLVVLSPVDDNWILTVLYVPELQLGLAIAKTKNVLRLLEGIELPPPPEEFEESVESNLQVLESIAIKAASVESAASKETPPVPEVKMTLPPQVETAPDLSIELPSPESFNIQPVTIPKRGSQYSNALSLDSELYSEMKKLYRNFGFDVLMLVDGNISAEKIADSMFQPNDRVIDLLKWGASRGIITVPQISEDEEDATGAGKSAIGRYVKCPHFEGDMSKVASGDQNIIRLCDGTRTTEQIAESLNLPLPKVVQTIAKYRKHGLKVIGKTL